MSQREILREFLYSLGFKIDPSGARKFFTTINSITGMAKVAGQAVAGLAVTANAMVAAFAKQMENLYYASARSKTSVQNIQALEYGFSQIGLTADDARASLEGMSQAMRLNPGMKGLLDSLVGHDTKGQDTAESMLQLVKALSKMPHYVGAQYAQMFGMDEKTYLMMIQKLPELEASMKRRAEMNKEAGFNAEAAAAASREYMNTLRQLWEVVEVLGQKMSVDLLPYFRIFAEYVRDGLNWLLQFQAGANGMDFGEFGEQFKGILKHLDELDDKFGIVRTTILVLGTAAKFAFDLISSIAHEALAIFNAVLAAMSGNWKGAKDALGDMAKYGQQTIDAFKNLLTGKETPEAAMEMARKYEESKNKPAGAAAPPPAGPYKAPESTLGPQSSLPRGLRQNNPGNLRSWGDTAVNKGFAAFNSMSEGLSAMAGQLIRYGQRGLNTIQSIISTYAPSSENDTGSYIAAISKAMGVGSLDKLNLQDPAVLAKLMGAMIKHEQGQLPFSSAELQAAASQRLGMKGYGGGVNQTNHITVTGVSDPNQAARAVGREMNQANTNLTRNLAGAVQ